MLVKQGARIGAIDSHGDSAVSIAAISGHTLALELLIRRGAEPARPRLDGRLPIHRAAHNGYADCVRALRASGSPLDVLDALGLSPLMESASGGYFDCLMVLIDLGASVDFQDPETSWTALLYAICAGELECVKELIGCGSSINLAESVNWTPLTAAASHGHSTVLRLLLDNGAAVDASEKKRNTTALMVAAQKGHVDIVELLLSSGASVTLADISDFTAADHAVECLERL
jgi:ankyrin repeat protein